MERLEEKIEKMAPYQEKLADQAQFDEYMDVLDDMDKFTRKVYDQDIEKFDEEIHGEEMKTVNTLFEQMQERKDSHQTRRAKKPSLKKNADRKMPDSVVWDDED